MDKKTDQKQITPLKDAKLEDVSGGFSGGWGAASYQYGFEGTYHNSASIDPEGSDLRVKRDGRD